MTAHDDAVQAAAEALRAEGWMCDPWGHEDGPQAVGQCRDCDLMLRDGARMAVAAAAPILLADAQAEIERLRQALVSERAAAVVVDRARLAVMLRKRCRCAEFGTDNPAQCEYEDAARLVENPPGALLGETDAGAVHPEASASASGAAPASPRDPVAYVACVQSPYGGEDGTVYYEIHIDGVGVTQTTDIHSTAVRQQASDYIATVGLPEGRIDVCYCNNLDVLAHLVDPEDES